MLVRLTLGLALLFIAPPLAAAEDKPDEDKPVKLDLAQMPEKYSKLAKEVAPGVKWYEAEKVMQTYIVKDKEEKRQNIVLSGKDSKDREVTLTFSKGAVEQVQLVLELEDLPATVRRVVQQRPKYGKPIQVIQEGDTLAKPDRYVLTYENAGIMTISADSKKIDTFNLDE